MNEQLIDAAFEMLEHIRDREEFESDHDLERQVQEWELIINQAGMRDD